MHAVIKTGGKQVKVYEGESIKVELLPLGEGDSIEFKEVLLVINGKESIIGDPFIENASVSGKVLEHEKGKKVRVFKMKRRKGYRKTIGHRQNYTKVMIESIKA